MNAKLLPVYVTLLFVASCNQNPKSEKEENYDSVLITEYSNTYDETTNRLMSVQIAEILNLYYGDINNKAYVLDTKRLRRYSYNSDTDYSATELSDDTDVKVIRHSGNTEEELWLKDGKDTVLYSFKRYNEGGRLEYIKNISGSDDTSSGGNFISESYYYYDKNGNLIKMVDSDLSLGEKTEEYYFEGITYDEALLQVPQSVYTRKVVCTTKQADKDTVITRTTINGELHTVIKEYKKDALRVEVTKRIIDKGYWVDSTYYREDKMLRTILRDSNEMNKRISISDYDEKGNLVKEILKYKSYGSLKE